GFGTRGFGRRGEICKAIAGGFGIGRDLHFGRRSEGSGGIHGRAVFCTACIHREWGDFTGCAVQALRTAVTGVGDDRTGVCRGLLLIEGKLLHLSFAAICFSSTSALPSFPAEQAAALRVPVIVEYALCDMTVMFMAFQIHFVLLISRQGKVRLTKWYSPYSQKERSKVIRELSGVILTRGPKLCNFVEWRGLKVVYKRYASLYFCMSIDADDNELEVLEIIHHFVEILDRYFGSVCELDLIFNFHKAYYILDELLIAGELQESSKKSVARLIAAQHWAYGRMVDLDHPSPWGLDVLGALVVSAVCGRPEEGLHQHYSLVLSLTTKAEHPDIIHIRSLLSLNLRRRASGLKEWSNRAAEFMDSLVETAKEQASSISSMIAQATK
ncbi:hypothetical protein Taro_049580, partial [Colocasia esculenta]|nr:hypothetical protein [Colocasia esculenta]